MRVRGIRLAALGIGLGIAMVACDDDTTEPPITEGTLWAADLVAEGDADVGGIAAAESFDSELVAEIAITDADPDATYSWYIGEGADCQDPEDRVGAADDYEALEPDAEGEAAGEASVDEGLDEDAAYHIAVWSDADELVSCGALEAELED